MDFYTAVTRKGDFIYCTYYKNGKRKHEKLGFKPSLFVPTKTESKYKSLIGSENLGKIDFENYSEMRDFKERYKGVQGYEIHGSVRPEHLFIHENFPEKIQADNSIVNYYYIDIEVESFGNGFPEASDANWPITAITNVIPKSEKIFVYTYKNPNKMRFDVTKLPDDFASFNVYHVECDDETDLLKSYLSDWEKDYPDIISGYNSIYFDMTYIVNRITKILGSSEVKRLSPFRLLRKLSDKINNREHEYHEIFGISQIDFAQVFRKFAYAYGTQESYSLDHIANVVIGDRKLDYSEYGSLQNLYMNNYQLYCEYNIRDSDIVYRMNLKTRLVELAMTVAFKAGCLFDETLGTNSVWEAFLHRNLKRKNIITPPRSQGDKPEEFFGGYVQEVIPGRYEDVGSIDVSSMYPNAMIQQNISPETLVQGKKHSFSYLGERKNFTDIELVERIENYTICCNGSYFDKSKTGVIPEILFSLYNERKQIKVELKKEKLSINPNLELIIQYQNMEQSIKILMNSLFGALGNRYFPYYEMNIALAITQTGQYLITKVAKAIDEYCNKIFGTQNVNYCFYSDTDSIYITLKELTSRVGELTREQKRDVMKDFIDNNIQKIVNKSLRELYEELNSKENVLEMSREVIADSAIWLAKKRYIMDMIDKEDKYYPEGELKVMGVEAVRSSTPKICRDKFKEVFFLILRNHKKETQEFICNFRDYFLSRRPEEVSFPRGINNISTFQDGRKWVKGTPIHVKGAIVFNNLLDDKKLSGIHQKLQDGDKGKFCYLKQPNFLGEEVISFKDYLHDELKLRDFVDYEKQFEKTFLSPISSLLELLNWKVEEENDISDMFA